MSYKSPFSGLKVVDLSQGIAGPYCAMLLAQYGADVIKVEPPEGDWSRYLGPNWGGHTPFSIAGNLGKRSVTLDLKEEADKARLWHLLDTADVFFEGFRPGVIERLGFSYEAVSKRNPRVLYVSVSGFGQHGPLAKKPAMDPVLQAFTGFMVANADSRGMPQRAAPIIVDMSTALYAFQGVSAALYARRDEESGRKIEVSLLEAAANLQCVRMMQNYLQGDLPATVTAPAGNFACSNGYLFVIVLRQANFDTACGVLGLDDMVNNARYASVDARRQHMDEVNARFAEKFATQTAEYWSERLTQAGIQNEQILDYAQFLEHEHVTSTGLISWLNQSGMDATVPMPNVPGAPALIPGSTLALAPRAGEHTDEILSQFETKNAES